MYKYSAFILHSFKRKIIKMNTVETALESYSDHGPPDVHEPAVQVAGGAGECVSNQAVEAVETVHQELPLCVALSQNIALIGQNNIQNLLQLILERESCTLTLK